MTSSNGNILRVTGLLVWGIDRLPVNCSHKGQWRGIFMFSMICAWGNSWVNNEDAGDLIRHCAHYNVIVMLIIFFDDLILDIITFFSSQCVSRQKIINIKTVLKIRTICNAQDLWKLAWSCKQSRLSCPPDPWNLPSTALVSGFQSSWEALKSTEQDST